MTWVDYANPDKRGNPTVPSLARRTDVHDYAEDRMGIGEGKGLSDP